MITIVGKIIDRLLLTLLILVYLTLFACIVYFLPHAIHVYMGIGWTILYWLFFGVQSTMGLIILLAIIVGSLAD